MNNAKYYNDSLAHDFEMFMPKEKKSSAEIVKLPENKRRKTAAKRRLRRGLSRRISIVFIIAFMLTAICAQIALRVEISEVNSDTVKAKQTLAELSGEQTRLNVEFERLISYNNLEASAKALGMKKMDKNQIVYIRVNDSNKAIDSNGNILTANNE